MWRSSGTALVLLVLGIVLGACQARSQASSRPELMELHSWSIALGDTTPFESFVRRIQGDASSDSMAHVMWKVMRVQLSATLGTLGYGTGPFTWDYGDREKQALAGFQRDMGLAATGTLDSPTTTLLVKAERALSLPDIVLPDYVFYSEKGFISAHGTWKATTNALGYPVNTVDVECNASTGTCEVVSTEFIDAELSQLGRIRKQSYKITHWSETDLLAVGEDWPGSTCHSTLSVSIPSEEVVTHQWCTAGTDLSGMKRPPSEMTLKLVDGSQLAPPFSGGDLHELHAKLYGERDRFLALRRKNMALPEGQ